MATTITNLFPNPSIETNTESWLLNNATKARITTDATQGGASLQINTSALATAGIYSIDVPAVQGDVFTVAMDLKGSTSVQIELTERTTALARITATGSGALSLSDWARYSVTHTVQDASAAYVRVYIGVTSAIAATFFMDGALLVEGATSPPYFDGDDPNAEWTGTAHASTSVLTIPASSRIFPVLKIGANQRIGPLRVG